MENHNKNYPEKQSVHKILAHSYSAYFLFFLISVCLDLIFNFKISSTPFVAFLGAFFLVIGTFLILWAQKTSRNLKKENVSKETFYHGPYCFTRTPTHFGLSFLMLGFGMIANAFFVVVFAVFSFIVAKFFFLGKEEKILAEKYGAPYLEYKKMVKF